MAVVGCQLMRRSLSLLAALLLVACSADDSESTTAPEAAAGSAGVAGQVGGARAGGGQAGASGAGSAGGEGGSAGAGGAPVTGGLGDPCEEAADCGKLHKTLALASIQCVEPTGLSPVCSFYCGNPGTTLDNPKAGVLCPNLGGSCLQVTPGGPRLCVLPAN